MTLHWTIISNELTQNFFCPIGVRATYLNQAVLDPTVLEAQTFVEMADICCYAIRYGKSE